MEEPQGLIDRVSVEIGATVERGKISARSAAWTAAGWLFVVLVALVVVLTASVFFFYGAALGIGEALGGRSWLGFLLTGLTVLFAVFLAIAFKKFRLRRAKASLVQTTRPSEWVRDYPWQSAGLAALGGFVVGFREPPPEGEQAAGDQQAAPPASWMDVLIGMGLNVLKDAVTPIVAAELAKRAMKQEE